MIKEKNETFTSFDRFLELNVSVKEQVCSKYVQQVKFQVKFQRGTQNYRQIYQSNINQSQMDLSEVATSVTTAFNDGVAKVTGTNPTNELCPGLTFKQRLIGFAISSGIGLLCTFLCFLKSIWIVTNPISFGIIYTAANVCFLGGLLILVGPTQHFKSMFQSHRIVASVVYLLSMISFIVILCINPFKGKKPLLFLALILQICAAIWYSLSYIPYGRQLFSSCMSKCCGPTPSTISIV